MVGEGILSRTKKGPREAIALPRLSLLVLVASLCFLAICGRLVHLHVVEPGVQDVAQKEDDPQWDYLVPSSLTQTSQARADILDRNGLLIASNLSRPALCANGKLIKDPEVVATQLLSLIPDLDLELTYERLTRQRACTYLKRGLTREQQFAINRLGIIGLDFQEETTRVYPHTNLVSHVVGFVSPDNLGLAGIEQSFDAYLKQAGQQVELSLDVRVQNIMREELKRAMTLHEAKAAAGILMDVDTAEVISLVSLPDFDPNNPPQSSNSPSRFNRATHGVYELGSVFKLFTAAMALESGLVTKNETFDVRRPIQVSRFTITDFAPHQGALDLEGILRRSSNIGAAKVSMRLGQSIQKRFLRDLGILTPLSFEVPEIGKPSYPDIWRDVNTMTISYGHGISVSPLQMAAATAALVNGGIYRKPTLLKLVAKSNAQEQNLALIEGRKADPVPTRPEGKRVFSPQTSRELLKMMETVVLEGSGKRAKPRGYSLGGKTGTAEKYGQRNADRDAQITTFVGAFPIDKPRYVFLALIDEPVAQSHISSYNTAGVVSAPIARHFIERAAPLLNLLPDEPLDLNQGS